MHPTKARNHNSTKDQCFWVLLKKFWPKLFSSGIFVLLTYARFFLRKRVAQNKGISHLTSQPTKPASQPASHTHASTFWTPFSKLSPPTDSVLKKHVKTRRRKSIKLDVDKPSILAPRSRRLGRHKNNAKKRIATNRRFLRLVFHDVQVDRGS